MFLTKYEKQIYAILRIVVGFLFLWHGSQILFNFPPSSYVIPPFIMWVAGPIELLGGFLIMIGLWTRWAAFITCGEMAFAYWMAHGLKAVLPISNQGELAMLYCFIFLFIAARGSGIFSFDYYLQKQK